MENVSELLQLIVKQNEQIIELSKIIADLRQNDPPPFLPEPTPQRTYPMHVPEDEEDARIAYERGDITREQLQEVLREVEFFNNEITVPTPGV